MTNTAEKPPTHTNRIENVNDWPSMGTTLHGKNERGKTIVKKTGKRAKRPLPVVGRARVFNMPQQEFIKRLGISNSYIRTLRESGLLDGAWERRGGRYWINYRTAVRLIRENVVGTSRLQPAQIPDPTDSDPPEATAEAVPGGSRGEEPTAETGYAAARAQAERAKAGLRALELHQRAGRLVPADEIREGLVAIARAMRDQMLSIPDRVSSMISMERREETIHRILTDEINAALREFDVNKALEMELKR